MCHSTRRSLDWQPTKPLNQPTSTRSNRPPLSNTQSLRNSISPQQNRQSICLPPVPRCCQLDIETIALSACETEYIAQTQAAREAIWLPRLFSKFDIRLSLSNNPVLTIANNQTAFAFTSDLRFHYDTKHIKIQWHLVRDKVETRAVRLEWIPSNDMVVDRLPYLVPTTSSLAFHMPSNMKASELMSIKYIYPGR